MNRGPCVLDEAMPEWSSSEYHQVDISAVRKPVMDAAEELTWREVPGFHRIVRVTGMGTKRFAADDQVLKMLLDGPYRVMHRSPEEIVIGGILPLSRRQRLPELAAEPLLTFRELSEPGLVKVAMNFLFRDGILSTETRIRPIGARANAFFAVYWAMIRVGSGLIRRSWLRGIRRRVEAQASG